MKLQQLRSLAEIARRDLSVSAAAEALHTSQPGVSRQLKALECHLCDPVGRTRIERERRDATAYREGDSHRCRPGLARERDDYCLPPFCREPARLAHRGTLGICAALDAGPQNVSQPPDERRGGTTPRHRRERLPQRLGAEPRSEVREVGESFD